MAASKRSCTSNPTSEASENTGKNRGKLWSDDATKILIQLWGEEAIQVALDSCKSSKQSSEVYKSLLLQIEDKGFKQFGLKELINKIKKLRQKYKVEKDKKKRSGNARQKTWKFFDSMDRVLATRHNVNPPTIADTMAENIDIVEEMANKYGAGTTYTRKCDTCNFEQEIQTEGVHENESGVLKIYTEDDEFYCPKCQGRTEESFDDGEPNSPSIVAVENTEDNTEKDEKNFAPQKKKRKSSIEKSLEVAFQKFKEASSEEFERYQKLENERQAREHEFHLRQMELENERRRKEREHEMRIFSLLAGYSMPPNLAPTTHTSNDGYFQL